MKKLLCILAFVASLMCACTNPQVKRAHELIDEYQQKADDARQELNEMLVGGLSFTDAQEAYIIANAKAWSTKTMVVVGENWNLEMSPLRFEAAMLAVKAEELKVPLSPEQEAYAYKFNEASMYYGTVSILQKWLELHSPTSRQAK